jgi:hypothetical protein
MQVKFAAANNGVAIAWITSRYSVHCFAKLL